MIWVKNLTPGSVYERLWEMASFLLAHPSLGTEKVPPYVPHVFSHLLLIQRAARI